MPITNEAMTSVETLKEWLGISAADETKDVALARLIAATSAAILDEIGRDVAIAADLVETYDADGRAAIHVRNPPINSVASVVVDGVDVVSLITFDDARIRLLDGSRLPAGIGNVVVSYNGGWSATGREASALEQACLQFAAFIWKRRPEVHLASDTSASKGERVFIDEPMPKDVAALLARLRMVVPA